MTETILLCHGAGFRKQQLTRNRLGTLANSSEALPDPQTPMWPWQHAAC